MDNIMKGNSQLDSPKNKTTRKITGVIGVLLAFAGFEHGLFAALQGNKPVDGFFIQAIGDSMKWWEYGTEGAFTVVPNYLITGILAMGVVVFIIFWSLFFVHKKHGSSVFLVSFILLTLVGGGIGFIPFFVVTWAYATRLDKPLSWWRRKLNPKVRKNLGKLWPYTLIAVAICWLLAIGIAIFGYFPGQTDPEILLSICWTFLLFAMIFINLSFVSGFANDIKK